MVSYGQTTCSTDSGPCITFGTMSLCSKAIIRLMDKILHDPKDPINYGNYGIFLIMGHAGFCPQVPYFRDFWDTLHPRGLET